MKLRHAGILSILAFAVGTCLGRATNQFRIDSPGTGYPLQNVAYRVLADCNGDKIVDGMGSATAIGPSHFMTANHVIHCENPYLLIVGVSGQPREAKLLRKTPDKDQAMLVLAKEQAPNMAWAPMRCEAPEIGDRVYSYVGDSDMPMVFKEFFVSYVDEGKIAASGHVVPGNSGGGLFDSRGCLLGVISQGDWEKTSAEFWVLVTRFGIPS